ncbi:MAG: tryptophan-rich sensory protein [Candidatus Omnitrophica bacterium]|nr:tryptophan-rich sensory protein [Candidatus Omnitrophota bacterium]
MVKILRLIFAIVICQAAGWIGALFTASSVKTWYRALEKPFFTPPAAVFGPVWTLLFLLMGISLYWVWQAAAGPKKKSMIVFGFQWILNVFWSILFFGLRRPGLALLEILVLWVAILATLHAFSQVSKRAAFILIPYFLWVTFAIFLNAGIFFLNRS